MNETPAAEMDGGWKHLIEDDLEPFLEFFFPDVWMGVDFTAERQFLDKALVKLTADATIGTREADKLVELRTNSEPPEPVLVHIEVQAQADAEFAERMHRYHDRIRDHFDKPVVSLAVLVDGDPGFRPDRYRYERFGCRQDFQFPMVKLLDYRSEAQLQADPSLFAFASLVQLRKIQAGANVERRYEFKLELATQLYQPGQQREDVLKRLRFMDFILKLPRPLAIRYRQEIDRIEEEHHMPYMTSMEQLAREEGRDEGRDEGALGEARDLIRQTIEVRFGQVPEPISKWLDQCTALEALRTFHRAALEGDSLEDLATGETNHTNKK